MKLKAKWSGTDLNINFRSNSLTNYKKSSKIVCLCRERARI